MTRRGRVISKSDSNSQIRDDDNGANYVAHEQLESGIDVGSHVTYNLQEEEGHEVATSVHLMGGE